MSAPPTPPFLPTLPTAPPTIPDAPSALPTAAYVHVPFCVHRCGYCDFAVVAGRDDLTDRYVAAVAAELGSLPAERPPLQTLFIGGGTPTHLTPRLLAELLSTLRAAFELTPDAEFSVEANPHDLTDAKLRVLSDHGVNRVSLGVQSFDAAALRVLERDHTPAEAADAAARCLDRVPQVSLDLIFGVPGLSLAAWEDTLRRAVDTGVRHVSAYGLTFEKGTAFWTRRRNGTLAEMGDGPQRDQFLLASDLLPAAGLPAYELSNYAAAGHRCRHNETYWDRGDYWGVGPGAASLVAGVRRTNHRSATTWLRRVEAGVSPVAEEEPQTPQTVAEELLMLGLRRAEGLSLARFQRDVGRSLDRFAGAAVRRNVDGGLLRVDGDRVALTAKGRVLADTVIADLFG